MTRARPNAHAVPRRDKGLLAGVMGWSLIVAPAALLLGGRGGPWGAASVGCGFVSLFAAPLVPSGRPYGSGGERFREHLRVAPVFTAAVLLVAGPWLVPWAVHDTWGKPTRALVVEASSPSGGGAAAETDAWRIGYRLADAATEQDLGRLLYGLPERTPVGAVVEVSVTPGGWVPPISAGLLDDGGARPYVTTLTAMASAHLLTCATVWLAWPRKDSREWVTALAVCRVRGGWSDSRPWR
ncbi:hypothetical protein [Streptomyces sp. T028]|uniref:hypothetical protein n=1 Tax=Streptomyces sp. T028 TaxID=3394379 RepID=UPI003A8A98C4